MRSQLNPIHNPHIVRLKKEYGIVLADTKLEKSERLAHFLNQIKIPKKILHRFERELRNYANSNLNQIGNGDNYTNMEVMIGNTSRVASARNTNSARVKAINLLFDLFKISSIEEIYQYIITPEFMKLSGQNETSFQFLRVHLKDIVAEFKIRYETWKNDNSAAKLLDLLLDPEIIATNDTSLGYLFLYSHSRLVADVIVNVYQKNNFEFLDGTNRYTFIQLQKFLADDIECINTVNQHRSVYKLPQSLPTNSRMPGKSTLEDEGLNCFELFQYDENTIYGVEQYLYNNYRDVFANNVSHKGNKFGQNPFASYHFYLLSAAPYMLQDPGVKNSYSERFALFTKHIRELTESTKVLPDKNIIFCGIINIENTHYIPYFIYKNQSGQVQVITVDPSPQIYTDESKDGKIKSAKKLERIFQYIFPGCTIYDPNIAQMLRERDCGPSSATTLRDAFASCTSETPVLQIIQGKLCINTKFLTIQSRPVGINYYNQSYVYPEDLNSMSSENRKWWMDKLTAINKVAPITMRNTKEIESWDRPFSIIDEYDLDNQISTEYNYLELVKSQERQDVRGVNISLVQSILRSDHEGKELMMNLIEHYKFTLTLPSSDDMVKFIKAKISPASLTDLTVGHDGDIKKLADEVVASLLDEYIPDALERVFKREVLKKLPISTDLDASKIVNRYLETQKTIYTRLTIYQQRYVRERILSLAADAVISKLILAHANYIQDKMSIYLRSYLGKFDPSLDADALVPAILNIAKQDTFLTDEHKKVLFSLEFLYAHDTHNLERFIRELKDKIIEQVQIYTTDHAIRIFSQLPFKIETLSPFFSPDGRFIPWNEIQLKQTLMNANIFTTEILNATEVNSYLGKATLTAINTALFKHINKQIGIMLESNIQAICTKFDDSLIRHSMDSIQKYANDLKNDDYFAEQQVTLLINNYNPQLLQHNFIKYFLYNQVRTEVISLINKRLHAYYLETSQAILKSCKNDLKFSELSTLLKNTDTGTIAYHLYQKYSHSVPDNILKNLTISGNWTYLGNEFNQWFLENIATAIQDNYQATLNFITNISCAITHITQIYHEIKPHSSTIETQMIINIQQKFQDLQIAMNSIWMFNFQAECHKDNFQIFAELKNKQKEFYTALSEVCTSVYKNHYTTGDITPSSLTTHLRYFFCCLLAIKTPHVLTKTSAHELDQLIQDKLQILNQSEYYPISSEVPLIRMHKIDELGDTYKQALTPSLLVHCLSYWYSHTSFLYILTSPSLWFEEENTPPLMQYIIEIINQINDLSIDKLPDPYIAKLKKLLNCATDIPLAVYESRDHLDKICASLIRTSAIQLHNDTELNFSEIKKILSLLEADKNAKRKPRKIVSKPSTNLTPVEFNKMKIQRVVEFNKQRAAKLNEKRKELNNNELTFEQAGLAPVDLGAIESQIRKEHDMKIESSTLENELNNVTPMQLKRAQFETLSFFQGTLTPIEKLLLQIQGKHDYRIDFNLDKHDIHLLERCIQQRWKQLYKDENNDAHNHYCDTPNRDDNVYIALAEILAYHYRKIGLFKMSYEILMPGSTRFKPSNVFQKNTLPDEICKIYRLKEGNASICNINLSNLVTTCSGYAIDIEWVTNGYIHNRTLINPYNKMEFSQQELTDILSHPRAINLVALIMKYSNSSITPHAIQMLTDYLNGAIFDWGFGHYYDQEQNRQALLAYTTFTKQVSLLSVLEQSALMNETIPHEKNMTIRDVLALSEVRTIRSDYIKNKDERVLAPQDGACLTAQGVYLAKVVVAYEGNNHKLKNTELVRRTQSIEKVPRREYTSTSNDKNLSKQEIYILELADRNPQYKAAMNRPR